MREILTVLLGTALLLGTARAQHEFTDKKGRKIEASILKVRGDKVTVMLTNGKNSTFPIGLLSEPDQEFVKKWKAANPEISLGFRYEKKLLDRNKSGDKTTEKWRYNIVVENRGFEDVKDLKVRYVLYKTLHDRYAKKGTKKKQSGPAEEGSLKLDTLMKGNKIVLETKPVTVEEVNSVKRGSTVVTYEKWSESLTGIAVEVRFKDRVVATDTFGTAKL